MKRGQCFCVLITSLLWLAACTPAPTPGSALTPTLTPSSALTATALPQPSLIFTEPLPQPSPTETLPRATAPATTEPTATVPPLPTLTTPALTPTLIAMKPGDYDQSIVSDGQTRTYILHIPTGYDGSKAVPLVFVLHGYGGSAKGMEGTGMSARADKENFIVVYPNGTGEPRRWNSGITPWISQPVDDVAFIRTLIDRFEKELRVDPKRVYVAGFSNGAMMAHRLGADLSDRLAAIAVVEGTIGTKQPDGSWLTIPTPAQPIPVIMFHGEQDTAVPYNGGQGNGAGKLFVKSVHDAVFFWYKNDDCGDALQKDTSADGNIIREDTGICKDCSELVFYTIVNGKHEWPTLQGRAGISGTDLILSFFARHPKP